MGVPKKGGKKGGKKPVRPPQQLSAEEHFENAEMAFAMDNMPVARTSFKKALDMEPENLEYLEGYGSFLAETGQRAEALAVLQRAVAIQPEEGFEKFMYLGQLAEGPEAEQYVRKGITVLRVFMQQQAAAPAPAEGSEEAAEADDSKEHLDATLCSCLCSLAELLLNKAQEGDTGVAEVAGEVEALLGEARTLAPASPEPLQALASLRQQQEKDDEALALLRQSLALWFKPTPESDAEEEEEEGAAAGKKAGKAPAAAAGEEEEGSEGEGMDLEEDSDVEDELPSFEFRFETAKLLLELDETTDAATEVLEQLLEENDEDPNVWLLLAMACQGGGDLEGALGAAEEGLQLCKKLKLPSDHDMLNGLDAVVQDLRAMMEGEEKEAKAEGKKETK